MRGFSSYLHTHDNPAILLGEGLLSDLIQKHTDPYKFAADVLTQMKTGKLKLKTRGASSTRELIALFYKAKGTA